MAEKYMKLNSLNIQFTNRALSFIKRKRVHEPTILINLVYRMGGGGCSGGSSTQVPHVNVMMVNGGNPGEGFERIKTEAAISIYMAKPLFEVAKQAGNPLLMDAQGVWMFKKLKLEGLDLSPLGMMNGNSNGKASCH